VANNYLEFSEVIQNLTAEEEAWLRDQLEIIHVFGSQEYPDGQVPDNLDTHQPEWYGCRAWRDLEDCDPDDGEYVGFEYEFHDDDHPPEGWGRHLWIFTSEWGCLERVAHLVRKFLRQFRPDQSWALTYAVTCSKRRVGTFGGGAVFVTASEVKWQNAWDFVQTEVASFSDRGEGSAVPRLAQLAEQEKLEDEALDEAVHEAASAYAASVNNGGLARQIEYLVEQLGAEETERILAALIAGSSRQEGGSA
jgi:hypothetical protein